MLYFILNYAGRIGILEILALILAYVLTLIISLTLHEFSHGFVAYKFGDDTAKSRGRLTLNPLVHFDPIGLLCFLFVGFGWAKPVPINPMKFRNYKRGIRFVSLAGIVTNIIIAFIFSGFFYFFGYFLLSANNLFLIFLGYFLDFMFVINISLAIFNLLPIFPLDGFNFVNSFLKPDNKFAQFSYKYGGVILLAIMFFSVFDVVYGYALSLFETIFFGFWGIF